MSDANRNFWFTFGPGPCIPLRDLHVFHATSFDPKEKCKCGAVTRAEAVGGGGGMPVAAPGKIVASILDNGWVEYAVEPERARSELLVSSARVRVEYSHGYIRLWNRGGGCSQQPLVVNAKDVDLMVCRFLDCSPTELIRARQALPPIEREVPVR